MICKYQPGLSLSFCHSLPVHPHGIICLYQEQVSVCFSIALHLELCGSVRTAEVGGGVGLTGAHLLEPWFCAGRCCVEIRTWGFCLLESGSSLLGVNSLLQDWVVVKQSQIICPAPFSFYFFVNL